MKPHWTGVFPAITTQMRKGGALVEHSLHGTLHQLNNEPSRKEPAQ